MSRYSDDLDQLHARLDLLMNATVRQHANRMDLEGPIEEVYDLVAPGGVHAIMVLTTEDPPAPEDHLRFVWFRVQDGYLKASDKRSKLESCRCDRCAPAWRWVQDGYLKAND